MRQEVNVSISTFLSLSLPLLLSPLFAVTFARRESTTRPITRTLQQRSARFVFSLVITESSCLAAQRRRNSPRTLRSLPRFTASDRILRRRDLPASDRRDSKARSFRTPSRCREALRNFSFSLFLPSACCRSRSKYRVARTLYCGCFLLLLPSLASPLHAPTALRVTARRK